MPRREEPSILDPGSFLEALQDPARTLRNQYKGKPIELAERFGLKLPQKPAWVMRELGLWEPEVHGPITPGLRELVDDVCNLRVKSAAVVGPRGGGKSQGVSFIEFYLVFIELFDALNLGGSELQADQVYQYLLAYMEADPEWRLLVKGDPMQSKTTTVFDAWIRVLTASSKSVRSPHAGGRKKGGRMAGGVLVIDEEAEASQDIVEAALPTINTARPSVNVRSSTFHNAVGSFAELIDGHVTMGYKLYSWDIFDVMERCGCRRVCQSSEVCFREDHIDTVVNPDSGEPEEQLIHKAYCGGRAMYGSGWAQIEEAETLWRRIKRNHDRWEVEQMGSRPTSAGHVIKDLKRFASNQTPETGDALFKRGAPVTICVDWGSSNAGVTVWQEQPGDHHALLKADLLVEKGQREIFGLIIGYAHRYQSVLQEVAADIGGGGTYLNPKLVEDERLPVRDVDFAKEKESAAAAWNLLNEAQLCRYPAEHDDFIAQVRGWKRINGRIQKGNDHLCDSSLCYFSKFADRLGLSNVRVLPRTFSSTPSGRPSPEQEHRQGSSRTTGRAPVMRSLGRRSGGR